MRKVWVLILILLMLAGCVPKRKKYEVKFLQFNFNEGELRIYELVEGKKKPFRNRSFVLVVGDEREKLKTDREGKCGINIPEKWTSRINYLVVEIGAYKIRLPYRKRKIIEALNCRSRVENYFLIKFACDIEVKKEKWTLKKEPEFLTFNVPVDGAAKIVNSLRKTLFFSEGEALLRLKKREFHTLYKEKKLTIEVTKGDKHLKSEVVLKFPPLDNSVGFVEKKFTKASFKGLLQNRTLYKVRVSVRAGYKRKGKWFVGKIFGTKFFTEREYELLPGETKEIKLSFPLPHYAGSRKGR